VSTDQTTADYACTGRFSRFDLFESLGVLIVGAVLMNFIHAGIGGPSGNEIGVAGHDSFYHIKMAALIPEQGIVETLPWLRYTYFTDQDNEFVGHHYGFHVLLVPFVTLSQWLTGDYLPGGRWAVATSFGLTVMLFNLLLIAGRVRWRWIWFFLFLLMPFQFFSRHAFVRAISPSLMIMLLTVLMMLRRNYRMAGLVVAVYTHLYLGGVIYAPLLIVFYVLASVIGPHGQREIPFRLIGWTLGGWILGVATHPYAGGVVEFLKLQVFGTGLTPDIEVGREWKPYENVWSFAQMSGNILLAWAIATSLRLRLGPRLSATELFFTLANFAFLFLTFKARRFIEYWPMFCLLSAAYLSAPLIEQLTQWFQHKVVGDPTEMRRWLWSSTAVLLFACIAVLYETSKRAGIDAFLIEWRVWAALAAVYIFVPLCRAWSSGTAVSTRSAILESLAIPVSAVLLVLVVTVLARYRIDAPATQTRLEVGLIGWLFLLVFYLAGIATVPRSQAEGHSAHKSSGFPGRCLRSCRVVALAIAFIGATASFAAPGLVEAQDKTRCKYDLAAVRRTMSFIRENSSPGDVIFTDDWDIFPVFFYYNSHNHYVVGLDPKFTHFRRPDLWERYVKITRGQVPADVAVKMADGLGGLVERELHVTLEDIRDHFSARFVVTDQDHRSLARKLSRAGGLAELAYPSGAYEDLSDEPYLVFRILNEAGMHEKTAGNQFEVNTDSDHSAGHQMNQPRGSSEKAATSSGDTRRPATRDSARKAYLLEIIKKLTPLHTELGEPEEGDWLAEHYEPGQTFQQYVDSDPTLPDEKRYRIYIQPLGTLFERQVRIVQATVEFLRAYFQLPVTMRKRLPDSLVPAQARRRHPTWDTKQFLSAYIIDEILLPRLPKDAAAFIAITATDLWPGAGWNYVFGEASTQNRVGVLSIYRYHDATRGDDSFRTCLRRTIATASHEIGHMFSMSHCIAYECNMCGSNSLEESDRGPLALCPQCLAKLACATGFDPWSGSGGWPRSAGSMTSRPSGRHMSGLSQPLIRIDRMTPVTVAAAVVYPLETCRLLN